MIYIRISTFNLMTDMITFKEKLNTLFDDYNKLITRKNVPLEEGNGILTRYKYPILTAAHTPVFWRYDLDSESNPYLMERIGMNATLNSGAIKWNGKYLLVVRVEGADRKSFFAVAESPNGIDHFRFWEEPITMPETDEPATNIYDMRLTAHEDGWIYGIFCAERKDKNNPDLSAATASGGIARTKDLKNWERLPDLQSKSQQRNVVLHPEFVDGKYAFYTRPQDSFIDAGSGGGIGWALVDNIEKAIITERKNNRPALLSHHQGNEKRRRTGTDKNIKRLVTPGSRSKRLRCRLALCFVSIHDVARRSIGVDCFTGWIFYGTSRRRARWRRIQCIIQ
jgi:Predicted glycosylase